MKNTDYIYYNEYWIDSANLELTDVNLPDNIEILHKFWERHLKYET